MPVLELFANQAATTVSSGGTTAPAAGTSQTWTVSVASGFPTAATGVSFFRITDPALPAEKMLVTNTSGTTWTVTRGAEGTTPVAHTAGFTIQQVITAGFLSTAAIATPLGGPSASQQTIFQQQDGTIVVLPLSYWGLSGDDGFWINQALGFLPVITGGSSQYDGTYAGPWTVGTIRLLPADYTLVTGIVVPNGGCANIIGHGAGTRLFCQSGVTGITSRGYGGGWTNDIPAIQVHGLIQGLRIDGTSAGASGVGIDIGGGHGNKIRDTAIVNFSGTNAIGLKMSNIAAGSPSQSAAWTEKSRFQVDLLNNTTAVYCTCVHPGGNTSMEYNDIDIYMQMGSGQTGMVVDNGVFFAGSTIRIRGNAQNSSVACLTLTGDDGSGNFSGMGECDVTIMFEHNATTNLPQTINFGTTGSSGNKMQNCTGKLRFAFSASAWTQSNALAANFTFGGVITGDANLISLATATPPSGWA